jgi:hypothetical protein
MVEYLGKIENSKLLTRCGILTVSLLACFAFLIPAQPALATFHLVSISEIYPGPTAQPEASYVELQMYEGDQNFVGGHPVTLYDSTGALIDTFVFASALPGNGSNQQTMLVGDDGVQAAFGVTPDLVDAGFNLPASGGAACWDTLDCVSWGDFAGSTSPSSGVPVDPAGIPDGSAISRRISGGSCGNLLDQTDDTNDSDGDFANAAPSPHSYATVPPPMACVPPAPTPTMVIDTRPASATTSTKATFAFHSNPAGADLECRLDRTAFVGCDSGTATYDGPLPEGIHSFRVRASNANGIGAPSTYSWVVDLTPPTASISGHPLDPSPGKSASFRYSSSESASKFECRLTPTEAAFAPCDTQPKTYASLADGDYEFEVRAIDAAGNVQPAPTAFQWTVDNSLVDTAPPETAIVSRPPDPSPSPIATFTYSSSEPGSSFQCKLDGGNFSSCPATGISYSGLADGPHVFQVRATDASNNVDPSPAGYSFVIALTAAPPPSSGVSPGPTGRPGKTAAPNTTIAKQGARTPDRTPTFRFSSSKGGASFQCKLDGGRFAPCRSPLTTKKLNYGQHVLQVRAVLAGATDPSPAKLSFTVIRKR